MNHLPHWLQALLTGLTTAYFALIGVLRTRMFQATAFGLMLVVFPSAWFLGTMPDIGAVERYKPWLSIQVYDRNNQILTTISGDEDRIYAPLKTISKSMQQAVISAEDRRFYEHSGADITSLVRAAISNVSAGRIVEGGSTISQQLCKNLFFKVGDRSYERKARELVLALQLEKHYSKEQILEMYLNQVYFGRGSYGIEIAARNYFGKPASKLEIHEAAFLAGLLKAPSSLSRLDQLQASTARKNEVLARMSEEGFLKQEELKEMQTKRLQFKARHNSLAKHPYYVSYVLEQLENMKIDVNQGRGLKVYTYLDPKMQAAAEAALNRGIKKAPRGINQGALVTVDVRTGGVLVMVGGVGQYEKHQWNRAVSEHTAGSAFKPFVYLSAFEQGILDPEDVIYDEPIVIPQKVGAPYAPKNFDGEFKGPMPVSTALAQSRNTCSILIAQMAGVGNIVNVARRAGISSRLDPYISLSLGSSAVSPLEMSAAYASFVRNGVFIRPQIVSRIETSDGKVLKQFRPKQERRLKQSAVVKLNACLRKVVEAGTGTKARLPGVPVIGKTGTADGATDVWFVGGTPGEVTALWGGTDKPIHKKNNAITGGNLMAGIWHQYTSSYMHSRKGEWKAQLAMRTVEAKRLAANPDKYDPRKKKMLIALATKFRSAQRKTADLAKSRQRVRYAPQPAGDMQVEAKRVDAKPVGEVRVEPAPTVLDSEIHSPASAPHYGEPAARPLEAPMQEPAPDIGAPVGPPHAGPW
ncbi:MAG: PBP1A family penicillin-binding protein [Candidatus Obscuribacterales bacterium]|nr:PBP1A family penicillin-binding protein [Candidatus Obscuribacterales bacterium]